MVRATSLIGILCLAAASDVWAAPITVDGILFPQGEVSFADVVADYSPVIINDQPTDPFRIGSNALGLPNDASASLGDGGSIILQFTDNLLTGSGTSADDLWIFEIGPDVEDTFVFVSSDGISFLSVGAVGGSTSGIDLDAFGFGPDSQFGYVLLIDDGDKDAQTGQSVGADIDAVGAISTVPVSTLPEPATVLLLAVGSAAAGVRRIGRRAASS